MSQDALTPAPHDTGSALQGRRTKPLLRHGSPVLTQAPGAPEGWIGRIAAVLLTLKDRKRERKDLQYLLEEAPPHLLNDVGLTRDQIERELERLGRPTFWHR